MPSASEARSAGSFRDMSLLCRLQVGSGYFPPRLEPIPPATPFQSWSSPSTAAVELQRTIAALLAELGPGDELVVVDNASSDDTAAVVRELAPEAKLVTLAENVGFAAGANRGVEAAAGELVVLLNPDAVPQPGFREGIVRPLADGRGWSAWMALVTAEDGAVVNTVGGVLHFTGIAWAGGAGEPVPGRATRGRGPVPLRSMPRGPARDVASHRRLRRGLLPLPRGRRALASPAPRGRENRARARGGRRPRLRVLGQPGQVPPTSSATAGPPCCAPIPARCSRCWRRRLWRPSWRCSIVAATGGWGRQKIAADIEALRALPRSLRERRAIQASRTISAGEFAAFLTPDLDSAYLGRAGQVAPLRWGLRAYWSVVRALLRVPRRPG